MNISIATDYAADTGCPQPYLKKIARAGFTHVHWCHRWTGDYFYTKWEVHQFSRWLKEYGLKLLDLHATAGSEQNYTSLYEYERKAGVKLVTNRMRMTADLGADVIVLHLHSWPRDTMEAHEYESQMRRSLDELENVSKKTGVRIAIENMPHDDFSRVRTLFNEYPASFLGLCYDAGHGNIDGRGPKLLDGVRNRLLALHLHDNDASGDQHKIPFMGSVDWPRLCGIIARSASYRKCINLEVSMKNCGIKNESVFLKKAFEAGRRLNGMVEKEKQALPARRRH